MPRKRKENPTTPAAIETPKRRKTQPGTNKAAQPTPSDSYTGSQGMRSLGSIFSILQEEKTDDDMPDLSFLDDWSAEDSQTPERPLVQPRAAELSPTETLSRFTDRNGVLHEVTAVILDNDLVDDGALGDQTSLGAPVWGRERLRERPVKMAQEPKKYPSTEGPLLQSIERDISVGGSRQILPSVGLLGQGNEGDGGDYVIKSYSSTRSASPASISKAISPVDGAKGISSSVEANVGFTDAHDPEYNVKLITGVKYDPPRVEYRIDWQDYPNNPEWIPEENCACPDVIEEFRDRLRDELLAEMWDENREEAQKLMRLENANRREVENASFPKHRKWRSQRRSKRGRFAARGTSNSTLEILRSSTVPRAVQANTARPPNRQRLADCPGADEPAGEDEVVWIRTKSRQGRRLRQRNTIKREATRDTEAVVDHRDYEMERREIQRRKKEDATDRLQSAKQNVTRVEDMRAQDGKETEIAKNTRKKERTRPQRERKENHRREVEQKNLEKAQRKEERRRRRELKEQQRTAAEEQREKEEDLKRKKDLRDKANAEKQRRLEETVHKYRGLPVVEGKEIVETQLPPKTKKEKLQQTLADASEAAARYESSRARFSPSRASQAQRARASSATSVLSINAQFRKARADEAKAKAKIKPSLVRSEFRRTLSERQAENLINQRQPVPLTRPRRKTFSS